MSDEIRLSLDFLSGVLLGVFFFGGLWWTVQKGLVSQWPAFWFLSSLLLRTGVIVTGFLIVSQGKWLKLIFCFAGFVLARCCVMLTCSPSQANDNNPSEWEAGDATQS